MDPHDLLPLARRAGCTQRWTLSVTNSMAKLLGRPSIVASIVYNLYSATDDGLIYHTERKTFVKVRLDDRCATCFGV